MDTLIKISVRDAGSASGGQAIVRAEPAAGFAGDGSIQIQRFDSAERFLGPTGWQVSEVWMKVDRFSAAGSILTLEVGPGVVDEISFGQAIELRIAGGGVNAYAGTLIWPDIAVSVTGSARGRSMGTDGPPKKPLRDADLSGQRMTAASPPPAPLPAARELAAEREPVLPPPPPRPLWPWVAGGLLLLALLVGLGTLSWYCPSFWPYCQLRDLRPQIEAWLHSGPPPAAAPGPATPSPGPTPAPQPTVPPAALACNANTLIAQSETVQRLYQEAERCGDQGSWEAALGALERAAEQDYGPAATALAKLYDPVGFQSGKVFSSADPFQAAKYYKLAVQLGDNDAVAPREALRQWLAARVQSGDVMAKLVLKDNWPSQ